MSHVSSLCLLSDAHARRRVQQQIRVVRVPVVVLRVRLAMRRATCYEILGVHPDASKDEIKSAYRSLARRLHPDVYKHAGFDDDHPWPPVQRSYAILTDPSKRMIYDDIVVRGNAMRLADPERFERWFSGHIRVDYETGTVWKGSEFFHQMGRTELMLLHNRHRIGWGLTSVLAVGMSTRAWLTWRPSGDVIDDQFEIQARSTRTAFLGSVLGGVGASWGQLVFNPPITSAQGAAAAAGFAMGSACVGALAIGPIFKATAGREPDLANAPAVRAAHANSTSVYQTVGAIFGASHTVRAAPALGKAYGRVALAAIVGGAVGTLLDMVVCGQARHARRAHDAAGAHNAPHDAASKVVDSLASTQSQSPSAVRSHGG